MERKVGKRNCMAQDAQIQAVQDMAEIKGRFEKAIDNQDD